MSDSNNEIKSAGTSPRGAASRSRKAAAGASGGASRDYKRTLRHRLRESRTGIDTVWSARLADTILERAVEGDSRAWREIATLTESVSKTAENEKIKYPAIDDATARIILEAYRDEDGEEEGPPLD